MDYGKKVHVGNFVLMKKARALGKSDLKRLRDEAGIPEEKRKELSRGTLPYIRIEDAGGSWAVEMGVVHTMYDALDHLSVVRDERGDWRVPGIEGKNAEAVLCGMFVDTTVVGDTEYQKDKLKVMCGYIDRKSCGAVGSDAADTVGASESAPDADGADVTEEGGAA